MKTRPECTYAFSLSEIHPDDKSLGNTVLTGAVGAVYVGPSGLPRRDYRVSLWEDRQSRSITGCIDIDSPMNYTRLCWCVMKDAAVEHARKFGGDFLAQFESMKQERFDRDDRIKAKAREMVQ